MVCDLVDSGYFAGSRAVVTLTGDVAETGLRRPPCPAADRFGRVDVLVNDAASYPDGPLLEMTAGRVGPGVRVNVTGSFMMTQAFARHWVGRGTRRARS